MQMPEYRIKKECVNEEETLLEKETETLEEYKIESKEVVPSFTEETPVSVCVERDTECISENEETQDIRYIGETMNTYIIVEYGDSVVFIDKHAAHERIIFNSLRKQNRQKSGS